MGWHIACVELNFVADYYGKLSTIMSTWRMRLLLHRSQRPLGLELLFQCKTHDSTIAMSSIHTTVVASSFRRLGNAFMGIGYAFKTGFSVLVRST